MPVKRQVSISVSPKLVISTRILEAIPLLPPTCKAIPLEAWTGPESSRRLRLPDFTTIVI